MQALQRVQLLNSQQMIEQLDKSKTAESPQKAKALEEDQDHFDPTCNWSSQPEQTTKNTVSKSVEKSVATEEPDKKQKKKKQKNKKNKKKQKLEQDQIEKEAGESNADTPSKVVDEKSLIKDAIDIEEVILEDIDDSLPLDQNLASEGFKTREPDLKDELAEPKLKTNNFFIEETKELELPNQNST